MMPLLSTICFLMGATVTVSVAPDQPVPHVYVDDPLIVELRADAELSVHGTFEITPDLGGPPVTLNLDPVSLRSQGTYWTALEGAPAERGRYHLKAHIESQGGAWDSTSVFCRIGRPVPDAAPPFCAVVDEDDARGLMVLKGISVRSVCIDGEKEDIQAHLQAMAEMGFQAVLRLTPRSAETSETFAKTTGEHVVRYDIDTGPAAETAVAIAKGLRRGGSKSSIAIVVDGPPAFRSMLSAGVGALVDSVVLNKDWAQPPDVAALRAEAESLGYEGMGIGVRLSAAAADAPDVGIRIARQAILNRAQVTGQSEVDTAFLYGADFGPGYVCLSELPHLLNRFTYLGDIVLDDVAVRVFENGTQWVAAFWSDTPKDLTLAVDKAAEIAVYDARGNQLSPPAVSENTVGIQAVPEPRLLGGTGGSLPLQAIRERIKRLVTAFDNGDERRAKLPPEVREAVKRFVQVDTASYTRMDFFNLLKLFPRLEELWHTGAVPRGTAVSTLAEMAQLARCLSRLEQERGEPFVEPLQNILANCGQLQSRYLTSSSGASDAHERPDWLMAEVGRLMAEAERVAKDGRPIEAGAVATLAEWRARALEIAAKAQPLGLPEKEIKPTEPPPVKSEEPKAEKKEEKKPEVKKTAPAKPDNSKKSTRTSKGKR